MTVDWDGQMRWTRRRHMPCVGWSASRPLRNHYFAVAVYLFQHRPGWSDRAAGGKTTVSSQLIDRVAARFGRKLHKVPVGFKWFVDGLLGGSLGFDGDESAGASFLRKDGGVWTTDKDGRAPTLLSGETTSSRASWVRPSYDRLVARATPAQKKMPERLSPEQILFSDLAGEKIHSILTQAPGNGAPLGDVKVIAENGRFTGRPSGTEEIYKVYPESFRGPEDLRPILEEAQAMVNEVVGASSAESPRTPVERRP